MVFFFEKTWQCLSEVQIFWHHRNTICNVSVSNCNNFIFFKLCRHFFPADFDTFHGSWFPELFLSCPCAPNWAPRHEGVLGEWRYRNIVDFQNLKTKYFKIKCKSSAISSYNINLYLRLFPPPPPRLFSVFILWPAVTWKQYILLMWNTAISLLSLLWITKFTICEVSRKNSSDPEE
jgi:hypothetical protein